MAYSNLAIIDRSHATIERSVGTILGSSHSESRSNRVVSHLVLVRVCVTVGGDQGRVEIHLIAHPDDDQTEARRQLTEQFATFDAGKAQCFLAKDREHLLAVIEASFGDFYDFNRVARNLFASRFHDELSSRRSF